MLLLVFIFWRCGFDTEREEEPTGPNFLSGPPEAKVSDDEWVPFRIFYETETLRDGPLDDPRRCHNTSQVFNINDELVRCTQAHLATEDRIAKIQRMCDRVSKYLSKIFMVKKTLFLKPSSSGLRPLNSTKRYDIDFYIAIYLRPRQPGSNTIASAGGYNVPTANSKRTFYGTITINPIALNNYGESDIDSKHRNLFETLLHETIHALFFDTFAYQRFESDGPTQVVKCNRYPDNNNITKIFSILTNKYLANWAKERWGDGSFGNCPMGIEVEDGGGQGTTGSHTEMRIFPYEIMNGMSAGGKRAAISDALFAIAASSGWYRPNFTLAEPLVFGTKVTNNNKPITNFPVGIPRKDWPDNYQCKYNYTKYGEIDKYLYSCSIDRQALAICDEPGKVRCYGFPQQYCQDLGFVDPDNTGVLGDDPYKDYIIVPREQTSCLSMPQYGSNEVKKYGAGYGENSMCFHSTLSRDGKHNAFAPFVCYNVTCTKSYKLFINVGNISQQCHHEGEILHFKETTWKEGFINCSDPVSTCMLKELSFPNNLIDDPKPSEEEKPTETRTIEETNTPDEEIISILPDDQAKDEVKSNTAVIAGSAVGAIIGVAVIVIGIFISVKIFRSRQQNEESDVGVMAI